MVWHVCAIVGMWSFLPYTVGSGIKPQNPVFRFR